MKKVQLFLLAFALVASFACNTKPVEEAVENAAEVVEETATDVATAVDSTASAVVDSITAE